MNIIGIDLGGTRIKTGIMANGRLEAIKIIEPAPGTPLQDYLELIGSDIRELQEDTGIVQITGMGLAFPGLVDPEKNIVIDTSRKYDDAPTLDLTQWAMDVFGLPLRLENDARLACLGEWKYGAGKESTDMVMCTLGTGVGSSAVIEGKILRGKHFQAGILGGHSIIDFQNAINQCSCGGYGCVEATASTWRIRGLAEDHPLFKSSVLSKSGKTDFALVFEASEAGDELAGILKKHCIDTWAAGIINLIHAYDPEVVVIGGGIMHSADILIPEFRRIITEKAWCPSGVPDIKKADFPDTAALLGITTLFQKQYEQVY